MDYLKRLFAEKNAKKKAFETSLTLITASAATNETELIMGSVKKKKREVVFGQRVVKPRLRETGKGKQVENFVERRELSSSGRIESDVRRSFHRYFR